jgi:hypothetical protein
MLMWLAIFEAGGNNHQPAESRGGHSRLAEQQDCYPLALILSVEWVG